MLKFKINEWIFIGSFGYKRQYNPFVNIMKQNFDCWEKNLTIFLTNFGSITNQFFSENVFYPAL